LINYVVWVNKNIALKKNSTMKRGRSGKERMKQIFEKLK
jgi:hypothetical protein